MFTATAIGDQPPSIASRAAYAFGVVGVGLATLAFGAFALQYQPVPAPLSTSEPLIYTSGVVLVVAGGLLLGTRTASLAAVFLALWFLGWIVIWQFMGMAWGRLSVGDLLLTSETAVLAIGAALLVARPSRIWRIWDAIWLRVFAAAQVVFGLSHFVYLDITTSMVPGAFPEPRLWGMATGVAHLVAALPLLAAYRLRLTGTLLCVMYLAFLLLVCLPLVVAAPRTHLYWLMFLVTGLHGAAAWVLRERAGDLEPVRISDPLAALSFPTRNSAPK